MPLTSKIDPLWAETGTIVAPSVLDQQTGWVDNQQPFMEWENYKQNQQDSKLNDIIDQLPDSMPRTLSQNQLAQKAFGSTGSSQSWFAPWQAGNIKDFGIGKTIGDLAVAFPLGQKVLLCLMTDDRRIRVLDPETMVELTSSGILGDLPTGGGEAWSCTAFCTDGESVYVMFQDDNASPNETHRMQAYDIATWVKKSSWPATGIDLGGTGTYPIAAYTLTDRCAIVPAVLPTSDPTVLITLNSWRDATSSAMLHKIQLSDGTILASGRGNSDATVNDFAVSGLAVTKDTVYFCSNTTTSTNYDICSANVSDLLSAGVKAPGVSANISTYFQDIIATGGDGDLILAIAVNGGATSFYSNLRLFDFSTPNYGDFDSTKLTTLTTYAACFDGFNLWVHCHDSSKTNNKEKIYQFNVANFEKESAQDPIESIKNKFTTFKDGGGLSNIELGRMCFDGKHVFFVRSNLIGEVARISRGAIR